MPAAVSRSARVSRALRIMLEETGMEFLVLCSTPVKAVYLAALLSSVDVRANEESRLVYVLCTDPQHVGGAFGYFPRYVFFSYEPAFDAYQRVCSKGWQALG